MLRQLREERRYTILFLILLFCYGMYSLSRIYGFSIFPDEFGYWSYAASVAGYDWPNIVSMGSYYSYGYSLILIPIFMLIEDAVTAYRIAVMVNFVLLALAFGVIIKLSRKLIGEEVEPTKLIVFVAIAVFYPSWLFYAQMTLTEIVLMAMYVFICALLYDYVENNRLPVLALLTVAIVYIYTVHMRSVAVVIAGILALTYYFFSNKINWKLVLGVTVVLTAMFMAVVLIKNEASGVLHVKGETEYFGINDYSGQIGKMRYIFTLEGIKDFMVSLSGKLLYMGMATYGTAYWGIGYIIGKLWQSRCDEKERKSARYVLYIFIGLATIGQLFITAIYNIIPGRIDSVTYGRYHEFTFPILMVIGLGAIMKAQKVWVPTVVCLLVQLMVVPLIGYSIAKYGVTAFQGYFMIGMSYAHGMFEFDSDTYFWLAYGVGGLLTLLVTGCIVLVNKRPAMEAFLILLVVIELMLGIRSCTIYSDIYNQRACQDRNLVTRISQIKTDERELVYIDDGGLPIIGVLQFMMREEQIRVITKRESQADYTEDEFDEDDLIIVDIISEYRRMLEASYDREYSVGHYSLYYNN